jgi:hypothetical protein
MSAEPFTLSPELLALAEQEAARGERECPLTPGSDVALELRALVGDDLRDFVLARLQRETNTEAA